MTNKDLNLSLNSGLIQNQSGQTLHATNKAPKPSFVQSTSPSPTHKQPKVLLISILTVLLVNIALLLWIGLSITNEQGKISETTNTPEAPTSLMNSPEIEIITTSLEGLEQQLSDLNIHLAEQNLLFTSSHHEITDILNTQASTLASTTAKIQNNKKSLAISPALAPAKVLPPKGWFVNLGTFSSADSAQRLQKQIKALGYAPVVTNLTLENKTAYRVQIPEFSNRENAEKTAGKIMQETNLNGLWAWKEE